MRYINTLLLTLILICAEVSLFAAQHQLEDVYKTSVPFVIDRIVKKQKVRIYADASVDRDMTGYYQQFFQNILDELENKDLSYKEDLKDIMSIIEFGAKADSYQTTQEISQEEIADIKFFFAKKEYAYGLIPHCPRGAAACFNENRKTIHLPFPNSTRDFDFLALHEIGHSLRLEDTYDGQFPLTAGRYGSGIRPSIMQDSHTLTCDDADAIINVIWLTLKHFNPTQPDLVFKSLCDSKIKFRNAQQMDRKPLLIDSNGERMVYSYCNSGEVKTTTHIRPAKGNNFYTLKEEKPDCEGQMPRTHKAKPEEGVSYTIKDFFTKQIIEDKRVNTALAHNTYMALPYSGGLTLLSAENKHGIPAYAAIINEKNMVIYLFAYLNNGYNMVYDFDLNGQSTSRNFNGTLFLYNRKDNSKVYAYRAPNKETEESKNNPLRVMLYKYYELLIKSHTIPLPNLGGTPLNIKEQIQDANTWQDWLRQNYPLLRKLEERNLIEEVKPLKEDKIALPNFF